MATTPKDIQYINISGEDYQINAKVFEDHIINDFLLSSHLGYTESGKNYPVELDSTSKKLFVNIPWTDTNKYHTSGSWNGLTYTATAKNGAEALSFTLPTGNTNNTVALGNHSHKSLTIQVNGASGAVYNGSSDKTINITPSAIGASASNHNHDSVYSKTNHNHDTVYLKKSGSLIQSSTIDTHAESSTTQIGYFMNDLTCLRIRGGSCTATISGAKNATIGTSITDNWFDGTTSYGGFSVGAKTDTVTIIIKCFTQYSWSNKFGIGFGSNAWACGSIKWELGYATTLGGDPASDAWNTVANITNNSNSIVTFSGVGPTTADPSAKTWNTIRITLTNFNNTTPRIAGIWSINYGSTTLAESLLPKKGGNLYGNLNTYGHITPQSNNTYTLGTSSKAWSNIYGTTLHEGGTKLADKYAAKSHNHDSAYLGKTAKAADSDKLDGKDSTAFAAASHSHTKSQITDFAHNHDAANITSGTLAVARGGTGKTTLKDSANSLINGLDTASSTPQDNDYYISQFVGGGTTTTTYHRRPMSALYAYIKSKTDSLYLGKTAKAVDSEKLDGKDSSAFALSDHNHASSKITAMTGYSKPTSTSAIAVSDSLNAAIGKLEKALDGKGTSNLTLGTTATTAAAGNHNHDTEYASKAHSHRFLSSVSIGRPNDGSNGGCSGYHKVCFSTLKSNQTILVTLLVKYSAPGSSTADQNGILQLYIKSDTTQITSNSCAKWLIKPANCDWTTNFKLACYPPISQLYWMLLFNKIGSGPDNISVTQLSAIDYVGDPVDINYPIPGESTLVSDNYSLLPMSVSLDGHVRTADVAKNIKMSYSGSTLTITYSGTDAV